MRVLLIRSVLPLVMASAFVLVQAGSADANKRTKSTIEGAAIGASVGALFGGSDGAKKGAIAGALIGNLKARN